MGAVCTALGVAKLRLRPVEVPLSGLLEGIGEFNAHCYGSFHSSRDKGKKRPLPISRDKLEAVSGLPAVTQRLYEARLGLAVQSNIAVGEPYNQTNVQNRAWAQGGVFDFIDHHGRQGPAKRHYVAWHLPNSYTGCHTIAPRGRMRKINRTLADTDLVDRRAQGNGSGGRSGRLFHPDGKAAGKAYGRDARRDAYWYRERGRKQTEGVWLVLPAVGGGF